LTGAATLVGAEVLRELLGRREVKEIFLPLPSPTRQRVESYLGGLPMHVRWLDDDLRDLDVTFDVGIHCAQREIKDHDLDRARAANVEPVDEWIALLERNPSVRLHHLSTAFTAGTRRGLYTEFDLDCGQDFHNAYERSKYEAEKRLRGSAVTERVTIYRPSHTLGRAATGRAFDLEGAYPLLASMAAASVLPGDGRARIDFVPADFVAAAMTALVCAGATGTFNLACGWHRSPTVSQAAVLAAKGRGRKHGPRLLPRGVASPLRLAGAASPGRLTSRDLAFTTARDLLHQGAVFDTYLADSALAKLGITRPEPSSWLETAVRAAEEQAWIADGNGHQSSGTSARTSRV
jgi:nucleoside-diphosphate-sugar epimerase